MKQVKELKQFLNQIKTTMKKFNYKFLTISYNFMRTFLTIRFQINYN